MKNQSAYALAEIIVESLRPHCDQIEIAGSIRRGRPDVNDIDLVILPKPGLRTVIRDRILQRCVPRTDGEQSMTADLRLSREWQGLLQAALVQLDVWFAQADERDLLYTVPSNWGSLLVCRTGSQAHNIRLCSRATALGLHWNPYRGVMRGETVIAARTEEDVFAALELPVIPPGFREAGTLWDEFRMADPPKPKPPINPVDGKTADRLFNQMHQRLERVAAEAVAGGYSESAAREAIKRPEDEP